LERAHGYQSLIRTELARRPGVAEQWICGPQLLARCPDLLAVCSAGAGYDIIDVDACTAAGVIACNNSGPGREAVAEHALGFMLALAKKIVVADRTMRRERVQDRATLRSSELLGKTLGIVGVGQIGSRLVELCVPFAMEVLAFDPYLSDDEATARGATKVELDELLARSDFVQLNCPLTPETEGLIGREQFALMKPTAFFVTTARGPVHDEAALYDALVSGTIAGAGIDVFHDEPPDPSHPLLSLDNVVASPHTAGITVEATRDIAVATAEQWLDIFAGKVPPRLLNPEIWPVYSDRFDDLLGVRPEEPVQ
jgi:D-3-phosphoglycerate dehydrogenase